MQHGELVSEPSGSPAPVWAADSLPCWRPRKFSGTTSRIGGISTSMLTSMGLDHLHGDLPACAGLLMACWIYGGSGQRSSGTAMGHHSVFKRYGRWEPQPASCWGPGCPRLTSARHGPWYFSVELPAAAGTSRRVGRGGFRFRAAAAAAVEALQADQPCRSLGCRPETGWSAET